MKNLTNTQLNILTNAFMERVELKKAEMKQTQAFDDAVVDYKKELDYKKIKPILTKIEKIQAEIEELESKKNDLQQDYKDIRRKQGKGRVYSVPDLEAFEASIEKKALQKITSHFPTKNDVQSQIVLMSIKKSDTILEDLADKYGIEEED